MGKQKYQDRVMNLFEKSPIVSYTSIERITNGKKAAKQYAKHLINNLIKKNKIKRITKGYYSVYDDPSLIVYSLKPAYLGLQDALSMHNLWEQETIPIILTSRKIRQGIRIINNSNVLIRRIDKKYIFGTELLKQGNLYFPYSDIEKTFIDMIYFKENFTKGTIKEIKQKINKTKLNSYLKHYPKQIKKRVLSVLEGS